MNDSPIHPETLLRERAWLVRLAHQLVRRDEIADEVAHDALAAAVVQQLPAQVGPRRWLAAILKRQLAGRRRAMHRRQARERRAARDAEQPPTIDTVARFEAQREVADAVLALAEPYRTCVLLRFWDGLSPGAIARRLTVPVETVRTRLKRGLAMLRERLDRAHGGDRRGWVVPLYVAVRPVHSLTTTACVALTLMTTLQKSAVLALLALACALSVPFAISRPGDRPEVPANAPPPPPAIAAEIERPAERQQPHGPARAAVDVPVASPSGLAVTGVVVDDADDRPLADTAVELLDWEHPANVVVAARTDAAGTFRLFEATIPTLGRRVRVRADDCATEVVTVVVPNEGPALREVGIGTIRCVRGTRYAGMVVDADGAAVADAALLLPTEYIGYGGFGPEAMLAHAEAVGATDVGGRFTLSRPLGPAMSHGNQLFAASADGIGWCAIEPSRERRVVDDLVVRLRPNATLRVRVDDERGQPLAGAEVRMRPRFGPIGIERRMRFDVSDQPRVAARFAGSTDARGEVAFDRLPIGDPDQPRQQGVDERTYDVLVAAAGYPEQPAQTVRLDPRVPLFAAVRLLANRELSIEVDVRDDVGAPLANALVAARGVTLTEVKTDATGHASCAVQCVDEIAIGATLPGHLGARTTVRRADAGGWPANVQLVLARTRELVGTVVDQYGTPLAGMHVFREHTHIAETDARGEFRVASFPVGPVPIAIALPSGADVTAWEAPEDPQIVVDAATGPATIVMQRRSGDVEVGIAIVEAGTGEPLEALTADLRRFEDGAGLYLLMKPTQVERGRVTAHHTVAGRWRLDVRTPGGHRGSLPFELTGSEGPTELRLELPRPGTITGRLQFVGTAPPERVVLRVQHATLDRTSFVQFRYPGRWHVEPATGTLVEADHGGTGALAMQPQLDPTFRLEAADPADELVFTVTGGGVSGTASVRIAPGQQRDIVVEVRPR